MNRLRAPIWALVLLWAANPSAHGIDPSRPRVVATLLPAYCIAINIGRDLTEVRYLVGSAGDVHDYRLTPRDRSDIEQAQLLLMNGLGLEPWLEKVFASVAASVRVVVLTRGLEEQSIEERHRHRPSVAGARMAPDRNFNPHLWLDPRLMSAMVTNALRGFQDMDPPNASRYAANAAEYLGRLAELDRSLAERLRGLQGVALVTDHNAFPYFARRYGLKVAGVIEEIPDVNPPPRHLAELGRRIREQSIRAIFVEPRSSRRLPDQLGRDLGVQVGILDTLETGAASPTAYEEGMRRNGENLTRTLP